MTTSTFQLGPELHFEQPDTFIYNGSELSWLCSNSIYTLKRSVSAPQNPFQPEHFEVTHQELVLKDELLDAHITDSYTSLLTAQTILHGSNLNSLTELNIKDLHPNCIDVQLSKNGFLVQSSSKFGGRYTLHDWKGNSWKLPVGAFEARIFPEDLAVVWWENKSDILYRWAPLKENIMLAGQMLLPIIDVRLGSWPLIIVESKKECVFWERNHRLDLEAQTASTIVGERVLSVGEKNITVEAYNNAELQTQVKIDANDFELLGLLDDIGIVMDENGFAYICTKDNTLEPLNLSFSITSESEDTIR